MDHFILSVEDNSDDVMLIGTAFRKAKVAARLEFLGDGAAAIEYFCGTPKKTLPTLLLLDLKLPKKSGLEVLAWLQTQPNLKRLPVVILSSSNAPEDIDQAYDLGANSYLVKPGNIDGLVELARAIEIFWLKANARPTLEPQPARRSHNPSGHPKQPITPFI